MSLKGIHVFIDPETRKVSYSKGFGKPKEVRVISTESLTKEAEKLADLLNIPKKKHK